MPKNGGMKQLYCVKCKKQQPCGDVQVQQTKNNRYRLKGTCSVCGTSTGKFISKSEGSGILSWLGIDSGPLKQIPIIGDLLG